jgi:hypothetical protein
MQIQTGVIHKTKILKGTETLIWSEDLKEDLTLVANIAKQYIDKNITIDKGTCCLGGGICLDVVRGKKRQSNKMLFISAPFQGNEASIKALLPTLNYITKYYPQLNAYYYEGAMN